jgi:dolichol-phosphate mannosyltransferase
MERPDVSVVLPVFDEEANLLPLYQRLTRALDGERFELIFVDDGSRDGSRRVLLDLYDADPRVVVLALSRNFGHQLAITAGVDHARGAAVVIMDADLQDPPEVVPTLLARWRDGFDVVVAVREVRKGEGLFKRGSAWAFYRVLRLLTPVEVPLDAGDFRLLSRRAADALVQLREQSRFLRGMASWVGFRQAAVLYEREPRGNGKTKYGGWRMAHLAMDAIFAFSKVPLRLATVLGIATALGCIAWAAWAAWVTVSAAHPVSGWASIMVAILLVGSVQLVCLGMIGEYIGRIYDEVRARPLYLVGDLRRHPAQPLPPQVQADATQIAEVPRSLSAATPEEYIQTPIL